MNIKRIPFSEVPFFSSKDKAYTLQQIYLAPFYKYPVKIESFIDIIKDKSKDNFDRALLRDVLKDQYKELKGGVNIDDIIEGLTHDKTFTLVTAHQPSLFTGHLYYIYKILSTIYLSRKLKVEYPEYNFIPLFVSGAEDHDFEEINHAHLYGKRLSWEAPDKGGSVGKLSTQSLGSVLLELSALLGDSEEAQSLFSMIEESYTTHATYEMATLEFVHRLFSKYGLLVLDMSDVRLKRRFIPIIKEELLAQTSEKVVKHSQQQLEAVGFGAQAYVRPINLFYTKEGKRARIEQDIEGAYHIVDTQWIFSREEMLAEVESHPERFSPNVVLRPLYQELILPNLAYIGGGGELAYWLERKSQFEHYGINFPMLIRRNSALIIDKGSQKKMSKLGMDIQAFFPNEEDIIKGFLSKKTEKDFSLSEELDTLNVVYEQIVKKISQQDSGMEKAAKAEVARQLKGIQQLEQKLVKLQKQRHETALNQIRVIKKKLFPDNGLQERYDNFIPFYLNDGEALFDTLLAEMNPLDTDFLVFEV